MPYYVLDDHIDNTGQHILTSSFSIVDLQKVHRANLTLEQGSFLPLLI
jgi:hypothetical protein